jgi:hypothetical protein
MQLIQFFLLIVTVCAVWAALSALADLWKRIWNEDNSRRTGIGYDKRWKP